MKLAGLQIAARREIRSGEKNVQRDWKGLNGGRGEAGGGLAGRWTRSWTSLARGECNPSPQLSLQSSWPLLCHPSAGGEVAAREAATRAGSNQQKTPPSPIGPFISPSQEQHIFQCLYLAVASEQPPPTHLSPFPPLFPVHKTRDCFAAALYRHFPPPANGAIICATTGTGGPLPSAPNSPNTHTPPHTHTTVLKRLLSP